MGGLLKKRSVAIVEEEVRKRLSESDIEDHLDSHSKVDALSANQGRILKDMIESALGNLIKNGEISIKVEKTFRIDPQDLTQDELEGLKVVFEESSIIYIGETSPESTS